MNEPRRNPPVGSVADEAANLLEALLARVPHGREATADAAAPGAWDEASAAPPPPAAGSSRNGDEAAPRSANGAHPTDPAENGTPSNESGTAGSAPSGSAPNGSASNGARPGAWAPEGGPPGAHRHGPAPGGSGAGPATSAGQCPTCGGRTQPAARSSCSVCPVCQVIDLVRAVSPQALDRLADFSALVSDGLRSLADSARRGDLLDFDPDGYGRDR